MSRFLLVGKTICQKSHGLFAQSQMISSIDASTVYQTWHSGVAQSIGQDKIVWFFTSIALRKRFACCCVTSLISPFNLKLVSSQNRQHFYKVMAGLDFNTFTPTECKVYFRKRQGGTKPWSGLVTYVILLHVIITLTSKVLVSVTCR